MENSSGSRPPSCSSFTSWNVASLSSTTKGRETLSPEGISKEEASTRTVCTTGLLPAGSSFSEQATQTSAVHRIA